MTMAACAPASSPRTAAASSSSAAAAVSIAGSCQADSSSPGFPGMIMSVRGVAASSWRGVVASARPYALVPGRRRPASQCSRKPRAPRLTARRTWARLPGPAVGFRLRQEGGGPLTRQRGQDIGVGHRESLLQAGRYPAWLPVQPAALCGGEGIGGEHGWPGFSSAVRGGHGGPPPRSARRFAYPRRVRRAAQTPFNLIPGGQAMTVAPIAASAASPRSRSAPPMAMSVRAH